MSDRQLTTLLDRAAAESPAMDVSLEEVVGAARRRRRQRRTAVAGGVASLVLVGALAWGSQQSGLLGAPDPVPAGQHEMSRDVTGQRDPEGMAYRPADRTLSAGGQEFRVWHTDHWVTVAGPDRREFLLGGPELETRLLATDDSGTVVAAVRVPDGTDAATLRIGVPTADGTSWRVPQDALVVETGEGAIAAFADDAEVLAPLPSDGLKDPLGNGQGLRRQVGVAGEGGEIRSVDGPLATVGGVSFSADGAQISASEGGQVLPAAPLPGGSRGRVFATASGGQAYALAVDNVHRLTAGSVQLVHRHLGQVSPAHRRMANLAALDPVMVGGTAWKVGVLRPGAEVLGQIETPEQSGDVPSTSRWSGLAKDVVDTPVGPVSVASSAGAFAWGVTGDWGRTEVGGIDEGLVSAPAGVLDGPAEALRTWRTPTKARSYQLVAVTGAGRRPTLVSDRRLTVADEQVTASAQGAQVYTAVVTVPAPEVLETLVQGIDTTGDGRVDLPLRTTTPNNPQTWGPGAVITLLGEPFMVSADGAGWPVLTHLDGGPAIPLAGAEGRRRDIDLTARRWSWSGTGRVVAVPGLTTDGEIWFTSDDPAARYVDRPEGSVEPLDIVVVTGPAGPVTLVTLPPEDVKDAKELRQYDDAGHQQTIG